MDQTYRIEADTFGELKVKETNSEIELSFEYFSFCVHSTCPHLKCNPICQKGEQWFATHSYHEI